jgi:hypothetical protein
MSSAFSTITSNVNLLLVNSSTITDYNPYIAYVSSVSIPGRIATVRDAVGLVSSPGRLIIVSTLKDVQFSDGTSSITISQPYGYISLSSRDKNTWDIINTFAFPMPSPVSYVSSIYATDGINANYYLARNYISTGSLITDSISSYRIQASTISTANLFSQNLFSQTLSTQMVSTTNLFSQTISTQNLRSFNNIFTNISTQTASTNFLFANNFSTNTIRSQNISVSSLTLSNILTTANITLSNDGQALLVNGIPTGTFQAISTATTTLNMNNNSISNVQIISTINLTSLNVLTNSMSTFNLQTQNLSSGSSIMNSLRVNSLFSNLVNNIQINTALNLCNNNVSNIASLATNSIDTSSLFVDNVNVKSLAAIRINNTINMCNNSLQNIGDLSANNILAFNSITSSNTINGITINGTTINATSVNATNVTLAPNYSLSNSGASIISAARQNFTNLFDVKTPLKTNTVSIINSNENNCIKTSGNQYVWNVDITINIKTTTNDLIRCYFTIYTITDNKEYYFDTYNTSNYLYIRPNSNTFTNDNIATLSFSDTVRANLNSNIYLKTYLYTINNNDIVNSNLVSNWTSVGSLPIDKFLCAAYGDHTWLVGSLTNGLGKSIDNATTFTFADIGMNGIYGLAYGNRTWVALGSSNTSSNLRYSTDNGDSFLDADISFDTSGNGVTFGNGVFVAVGKTATGSNLKYSTNGINWNEIASGPIFDTYGKCVRFYNNRFIATGEDTGANAIIYSDDGSNWTSSGFSAPTGSPPNDLAYSSGIWYAVGSGYILVSSNNGASWSNLNNSFTNSGNWSAIFGGEGIIVNAINTGVGNRLYYSSDGLNSGTTTVPFITDEGYGLAYGNHLYLALGNKYIYRANAVNFVNYSLQPAAIQPPN